MSMASETANSLPRSEFTGAQLRHGADAGSRGSSMADGVGVEAATAGRLQLGEIIPAGIRFGIEDATRSLIQGDLAPGLAITDCRNARRDSIAPEQTTRTWDVL
jgi:hypothetical protein